MYIVYSQNNFDLIVNYLLLQKKQHQIVTESFWAKKKARGGGKMKQLEVKPVKLKKLTMKKKEIPVQLCLEKFQNIFLL